MTAVAAPSRRAAPARGRPAPAAPRRLRVVARPAPSSRSARSARTGWVGTLMVCAVVFALVTAVVFHVVLAQHQLELDHLNGQIAAQQRRYEENRLTAAELAAPDRIIQEAKRLGLVLPASPPQTLTVPDAPLPAGNQAATATTTLGDWTKAKSSLGHQQP